MGPLSQWLGCLIKAGVKDKISAPSHEYDRQSWERAVTVVSVGGQCVSQEQYEVSHTKRAYRGDKRYREKQKCHRDKIYLPSLQYITNNQP